MLVSLTKACVLVEAFRCQVTSIIVGLRPHQTTTGHFYHAHLIWELSWSNACIGYKRPHFLKRSLHQWADYSRWDSLIDVTWRTVNKEQIYQRAHWSLNTVVGIFLDVVNRSLQAPAVRWFTGDQWQQLDGRCLHLFTSQTRWLYPYTTCYLNCLFYIPVVLYCSRAMYGRLTCHWSWDFKRSVFCNGMWSAAPRLLSGLSRDALQTARKGGRDHTWRHSRCSHPLDGRHPTDYNRLDWPLSPSLPFHHSPDYARHAGSFVPCRRYKPLEKRLNRCHQELCMPSHRQLYSNILCSSTQLINIIILYTILSISWQNSTNSPN